MSASPIRAARVSLLLLLLVLLAPWHTAHSQAWPVKPVRMVAPYPPGGGLDVLGRQVADKLTQVWSQSVLVENRPGSSTIVGTELVARSPADGYTILLTGDGTMTINPHLFSKLPYSLKDFAPATQMVLVELVLTAHAGVANSVQELIKRAREKPGTINYGSFGSGSDPHLAFEMFKHGAGIDLTHVPYKGGPQVIFAVVAGDIQLGLTNLPTAQQHVNAKKVVALAFAGTKRSQFLPDVPTFDELGLPDVDAYAGYSLFVPAGTPREVVMRIYRDTARILNEREFFARNIIAKGYTLVASSPDEFTAYLEKDFAARGKAVKISGAKAD